MSKKLNCEPAIAELCRQISAIEAEIARLEKVSAAEKRVQRLAAKIFEARMKKAAEKGQTPIISDGDNFSHGEAKNEETPKAAQKKTSDIEMSEQRVDNAKGGEILLMRIQAVVGDHKRVVFALQLKRRSKSV